MNTTYEDRGVSPHKPEVKEAIKNIDQGLYPRAFCKAIPDVLSGSADHCLILHADGAGTKSSLAYVYYKETGDIKVFESLAQDSLVMNLDDVICVGATGPFVLSNTIGRNLKLINGDIIKAVIKGYDQMIKLLRQDEVEINSCGGETADLGDLARTIILDSVLATRMLRRDFINAGNVKAGQDIVGLASFGQAVYEEQYNSGIGTNGFTAARHEVLSKKYRDKYPESFAPEIHDLAYTGKFDLLDKLPQTNLTVGQALLSPTRTYAPVIKDVLAECRQDISAIFHNSGGGQTKCLNFGHNIRYVKDNVFSLPPIFKLIKENTNLADYEMYRVFNMGSRMEIVCDSAVSQKIIEIAGKYKIKAKVVGRTEKNNQGVALIIKTPDNQILEYV